MPRKPALAMVLVLALLGGCTATTHLRDPKKGTTVTCGGEMWTPTSGRQDQHCLDYWGEMGFERVP